MSQLKYFIPTVSSRNLGPRQEILDIAPIAMSWFAKVPQISAGQRVGVSGRVWGHCASVWKQRESLSNLV